MAAKRLMDITMISSLFLLLHAGYVSGGAIKTDAGIIPIDGVSPVPTEAPGLNGIPSELRRRAVTSPNWCGLIDGDDQNILSCSPFTPCVLNSDFYRACCSSLSTDLCFDNYVAPTTCFNYNTYTQYATLGSLKTRCSDLDNPYCYTITSSGFSPLFVCTNTNSPRLHSIVPIAAYYSSLDPTPSANLPTTSPDSSTPESTSNDNSASTRRKKPKLGRSAKAGIGSGVSLSTLAVIALFTAYFRRKQKRTQVSPTEGGAEPAMAQTNHTPQDNQNQPQPQGHQGVAQPVQQQYQPQPQSFQNAAQPIQPQLDNTMFPNSADTPTAPIYTSSNQNISAVPISPSEP